MNKGIGAGGANTNYYGKLFEDKTNNYNKLLDIGYIEYKLPDKCKYNYYLSKTFEDKTIIFTLQNGLKKYMKFKLVSGGIAHKKRCIEAKKLY